MSQIPHWYVVRGKDVPEGEFDAFVRHIGERGYRARWGRRVNTYLEVGELEVLGRCQTAGARPTRR